MGDDMTKPIGPLVLATALALSFPTMAFDQLRQFAGLFTLEASDSFFYAAPLAGLAPDSPTLTGIPEEGIRTALFGGDEAAATATTMTGIDFSQITGVLTFGIPPDDFAVVFGRPGFTADAAPTLLARDFEERMVNGHQVLALGDDHAMDFASARNGDPFNGGMGQSQRVVIGGDFLMKAAAWPPLESALDQLSRGPTLSGRVWQDMIAAVEAASGYEPHLDAAIGWTGSAFIDAPTADLETFDITIKEKTKHAPGDLPLFPAALFALTQNADTVSVHIALPYGLAGDADVAAAILAERLVLNPFTPHRPRTRVVTPADMPIAVVSLDYPLSEAGVARDLMLSWNTDTLQRQFVPLQIRLY